jgi:hypothetical protein
MNSWPCPRPVRCHFLSFSLHITLSLRLSLVAALASPRHSCNSTPTIPNPGPGPLILLAGIWGEFFFLLTLRKRASPFCQSACASSAGGFDPPGSFNQSQIELPFAQFSTTTEDWSGQLCEQPALYPTSQATAKFQPLYDYRDFLSQPGTVPGALLGHIDLWSGNAPASKASETLQYVGDTYAEMPNGWPNSSQPMMDSHSSYTLGPGAEEGDDQSHPVKADGSVESDGSFP